MQYAANAAVIFDMDGVLVDSADAHLHSWQKLAEEINATVTAEQFAATFGRQNRDIIPLLFGDVSDHRLRDLGDRKEELYRELVRGCVPAVPGAVELVRGLHEAGMRLAIGSSGPLQNLELILDEMALRECFDVIVSADDVTRGKPDPQVFLLAAKRLSCPPFRCVVVEDAPSGVQAARSAGAFAVAILMHHPARAFDGADLIVPRLADLTVQRLSQLVVADGKQQETR